MIDNAFHRRVKVIVPILSMACIAAFVLAAWSFISAHQQLCAGRDQTLDVLRDIVLIATAPDPTAPRTAEDQRRTLAFQEAVFARINQARC